MTVDHEIYCQNCFSMILAEAEICPVCGKHIAYLSAQGYREKLLHALQHPLADIRLGAIIALGLRSEAGTAMALTECALRHPTDVVEGMEVVNTLNNFDVSVERRHALRILSSNHPAHAIRVAAEAILKRDLAGDGSEGKI